MKVIFKTDELVQKLKNLAPTAEAKQTLMILGNMKAVISNGKSTFISSDLEVEVTSAVPCESDGNAEFTLPAKKFLEICSALSQHSEITLNIDDTKANIIAGKSKVMLSTLPSDDFPTMSPTEEAINFEVDSTDLKELFEKTSFAMAYQDARHFLNGLHICVRDGRLVSVCTDGHRLAKFVSGIKCDKEDLSFILPRKAIQELSRIITSFNDNKTTLTEVSVYSNMVSFKIRDYVLISKLIEGNYPDFDKVIPEKTNYKLKTNKKTLKDSLNIISKVVNQQYKGVKLTPTQDTLHLISSNTDSEIGEDSISANYDGEDLSIGFNISYLQDVIDAIDGEDVLFHITDQNSGCILQDPSNTESTYVIMPMRV